MSDRNTTAELLDRLRRHYIKPGDTMPGGVFVPECGRNGGSGSGNRCDALYVGFTSSSGRLLVGHEIKVSRADWRRELDHAGKADVWADECHEWWIVAPSTDIVPPGELPAGWGLMVPSTRSKNRMQVEVRAATHVDRVPSWPTVRSVMSRLDTLQRIALHDAKLKAQGDAAEAIKDQLAAARGAGMSHEDRARLDALSKVESDLGVGISNGWFDGHDDRVSPETFAVAVTIARSLREAHRRSRSLHHIAEDLKHTSKSLEVAWKVVDDALSYAATGVSE